MSMRDTLIKPRLERMRCASRGAPIALLSQSDGYECYLDDAVKVHAIIGDLGTLKNIQVDPDDWDEDSCEVCIIPNRNMFEATRRLAAAGVRVALLDSDSQIGGSVASYVCIAMGAQVPPTAALVSRLEPAPVPTKDIWDD